MSTKNQIYEGEPSNYEQKCLCVLLLDTSYSMEGGPINELNNGLKSFQQDLLKDELTSDRLEVAIVTFDSVVKTLQKPALLTDFSMPTLEVDGSTCMVDGINEAIDLVTERKQYYKQHGIPYYRPWIVMMTDGEPDSDQDVDSASSRIQAANTNKEFVFMPIGVGEDVNFSVLKQLSTPLFPPMKMQAVKFCEFFQWLSNSMSIITTSEGGNVTTASAKDWLDKMI